MWVRTQRWGMADTMESEENHDESPTLFRVRPVGPTWDNRSPVEGELRIAPQFLEEYEAARRAFVAAFREATYPQLGETDRLIPVSLFNTRWSDEEEQLHRAIKRLADSWDSVLADARQRLGDAIDEKHYPERSAVFGLFNIKIEGFEEKNIVSTKQLLGAYSKSIRVPNAAEHVMWARQVEKERERAAEEETRSK